MGESYAGLLTGRRDQLAEIRYVIAAFGETEMDLIAWSSLSQRRRDRNQPNLVHVLEWAIKQ